MSGYRLTQDAQIRELLEQTATVAVVGLSPRPERPSHRVAAYLQQVGYRIVPVHPEGGTTLGERVYGCLTDLPRSLRVDVIDVFRRPSALPDLIPRAVHVGPRVLWFQLGVTHPEAEARALEGGLDLVVDRCMLVEHRRLLPATRPASGE
jgi:predicted CoA-binding protein